MSAAKRRAKRKIAQLVRMDVTRRRMRWCYMRDAAKLRSDNFFFSCMVPLGRRLKRMGLEQRARDALRASGTDL